MARKSTKGSLEWRGDPSDPKPSDCWRAHVTVDKKRHWIKLPPTILHSQEAKARKLARQLAALARAGKLELPALARRPPGSAPSPTEPTAAPETFAAWLDRWLVVRKKRGLKSNQSDTSKVLTWLKPRLGDRPTAAITRAEIEAWVEWIDEQVQEDALSWKTAHNAWGLLSRAMTDASSGKVKALRCRDDNPCADVAPPDRGTSKSKVYLYPDELLTLLGCEAIPREIRRAYAVTTYLYPRAGEVEALHWEDIDLTHSTIHVHRAVDPESGEIRETKGKAARRFDLEPELATLLQAMRRERPRDALVFSPWPLHKDRAGQFRRYLAAAGVDRAELFAQDKTRKNITFHDLRATGTTWAAIRGDDPLRIMHRAGHKDLATTQGYIREAENVSRDFGEVFPPLPETLLGAPNSYPDSFPRLRSVPVLPVESDTYAVRGKGFEHQTAPPRQAETREFPRNPTADKGAPRGSRGLSGASGTNPGTNRREALTEAFQAAAQAALDAGDYDAARTALDALARLGIAEATDPKRVRR